jgi:predicted nucleic acid-binding protein
MELIQGARDSKEVREALRLTAPLPIVWPTTADCQRALADFTAFHVSQGLGLLDALIAACAVGLSADLCTFNDKHYRMVPGLVTVRPYTR